MILLTAARKMGERSSAYVVFLENNCLFIVKSDSELMNELSHRVNYLRELSSDESASLKSALIGIYKDVATLCNKYNLTYMLSGGSCLGAVRHKGFIPWDDDLDIMMPRKDYETLILLCKRGELGDKYEINYPNPSTDSKNVFLKIYRKNSINQELFNENTPFPKGIYLDVFALDGVPANKLFRFVKGCIANLLQYISIMVLMAQYPSKSFKKFVSLDVQLKRRYKLKLFLGKIFGVISHKTWVYCFDKFVANDNMNNLVGIPTGRKYYNGEIFEASVFFPPQKVKFEDLDVFIPADYDKYLTNLYKDYMQLPPLEKRERHFIMKFELPND
mgnify:FL=1|jgi:lipopolysaccharide cholinephosphotransferase